MKTSNIVLVVLFIGEDKLSLTLEDNIAMVEVSNAVGRALKKEYTLFGTYKDLSALFDDLEKEFGD